MIITYQGAEFFKVQFGDTTFVFNPVSKKSNLKTPRFGADIAMVSINHPDMNGVETVSLGDKLPFAITGPGEYEVKGVFITGLATESMYGGEKIVNTVYVVSLENLNLCFLGALSSKELPTAVKESFDNIDILFVPIGADGVLSPADAYRLSVSLEPGIIIPMHFGALGQPKSLQIFLKEGGAEGQKPIEKLTIKKKDLEGKEGEIVVLESPV